MAHIAANPEADTGGVGEMYIGKQQNCSQGAVEDCVNLDEIFSQYGFYLQIVAVTLLNVHIVLGNLLVILAVYTYRKLRQSQTNKFIVSLAFSDFLLGIAVMPFTSTFFLLNKHWIFGTLYCRVWLAVDVWLCTASILNLVAISYERYLAIRKPMAYSRLMTYWRTRMLLISVWILALMISVPGFITNDGTPSNRDPLDGNLTCPNRSAPVAKRERGCVHRIDCSISESSPIYIVYSACGSFFVPAAVMLAFYAQIYRTARRTLRAMHTGTLMTKGHDSKDVVVLRVHIGGHGAPVSHNVHSRYFRNGNSERQMSLHDAADCVALPNTLWTNGENKRTSEAGVTRGAMTPEASSDAAFSELPLAAASATANEDERPQHAEAEADQDGSLVSSPLRCVQRTNAASADRYERASRADASRRASRAFVPPPTPRSINSHNSRANRETKAAKTVAIICGSFLLCWLGFFCAYLLSAFCNRCVPDLVWDILFWLGYINSACNPCVYALFSRDFRTGFCRLLRCMCCWRSSRRGRFKQDHGRHSHQARRFDTVSSASALGHTNNTHHVHYRRTSASQSPLDELGSTRALESGM